MTGTRRLGTVAVIGGGPAGLMAADRLAAAGASVTVYERMPSVGRKFQLAGRGGLNLTHSEPRHVLLDRYGPARSRIEGAVDVFGQDDLRAWCASLGQPTFIGSSGRVFPSGFRATALLRAWLHRLTDLGVEFRVGHTWTGWRPPPRDHRNPRSDTAGPAATSWDLVFTDPGGRDVVVHTDAVVLAMGGASWPRVGSNGAWVGPVTEAGIAVAPLRPSNCGFIVAWSATFSNRFAGTPIKNLELTGAGSRARGEAMVTATGIEGGAVYAVSSALRQAIDNDGSVTMSIDLRPGLTLTEVERLIDRRRRAKDSTATVLRRAGLAPVAIGLMREVTGGPLPTTGQQLAALVKAVPIALVAAQPIDRAISTAGGIRFTEVDERFMLRRRPGTFVAGEMLDWEAPTGGYLLQATFSTGAAAADGVLQWLRAHPPTPAVL